MNITTIPEEAMANATLTSPIYTAITPKVTGMLSLMGSALIFLDGIQTLRRTSDGLVSGTYHRMMVGMSVFDITSSMCHILSTWALPIESGAFQAMGSQGTCKAQGFFSEVGNMAVVLYNATLCMYQLLTIRIGWKEYGISKIELMFHVIPILVGLTMGIMGLVKNIYGPAGHMCWYVPEKTGGLFRLIHLGIIWFAIIFVAIGMLLIYWEVRRLDHAMKIYNVRRSSILTAKELKEKRKAERRGSKTRKVAERAMLLMGAMFFSWVPITVSYQSLCLIIFPAIHRRNWCTLI